MFWRTVSSIALLLLLWLTAARADEPKADAQPSAAALPKIKALIVDGWSNHPWWVTTPILRKILESSGRFTVDVATAPQDRNELPKFKPHFDAYDVTVMNYNGDGSVVRRPDADWSEETQHALEKYVGGGGHLVIVHSANNSFPNWKEYNRMTGLGGWGGRNEKSGPYLYYKDDHLVRDETSKGTGGWHGPEHPFQVVIRVPDHPITKGMPTKWMHARDELYSHLRGPAENVTVLATAYSPKSLRGRDLDEPMMMTIQYEKGRVFHTPMGHGDYSMRCAGFVTVLQRGAEWAATGNVTVPIPADFPTADQDRESVIFKAAPAAK
ncbi:MAG: ThuA domain-containing protein [Planctomycetia bacterium]|nr:ThuA domain-containing protein [Planctomycetia bacterium]